MKRTVFLVFSILILKIYSQNDTIYLSDTIISSVRIMNQDENNLNYFSINNNKKKNSSLSLDLIEAVVYENDKIEVFCDLISKKKFLGMEETISINYGNRDSLWIDNKLYNLISQELKKYNSIIDALNYMGSEGWKTINTYSSSKNSYTIEHYILKKEIKKELKK